MRTFSGARAIGLAIYYASPGKFGPLSATNVFISATPWQCPQNCVVGRIRESVSVSQQFVSYKHKIFPSRIRPIEESTLSTRKTMRGCFALCVREPSICALCWSLWVVGEPLWVEPMSLCGLHAQEGSDCVHKEQGAEEKSIHPVL